MCSNEGDVFTTLRSEQEIITDYNSKHTGSEIKMSEKTAETYKSVSEYIRNNPDALDGLWKGYDL